MFLHLSSNPLWSKLFQIRWEVVTAHWMWNTLLTRAYFGVWSSLNGRFFFYVIWLIYESYFVAHMQSFSLSTSGRWRQGSGPALIPLCSPLCPLWLLWFCFSCSTFNGHSYPILLVWPWLNVCCQSWSQQQFEYLCSGQLCIQRSVSLSCWKSRMLEHFVWVWQRGMQKDVLSSCLLARSWEFSI